MVSETHCDWLGTGTDAKNVIKSYLGEKYRRLRTKLGAPKTITAMAHQIARIIWYLITHQVAVDMSIFADLEQAHQKRRLNGLNSAARQMGYQLTPIAA